MNEFELRRQLRDMRSDDAPQRDLWPGIAQRLPSHEPARRRSRWLPLALVASLAVAALITHQLLGSISGPAAGEAARTALGGDQLPRAAAALEIEYRAALASLSPAPLPAELRDTALLLDDSALELRQALNQQPDSVFLLDQLRRTYALRLRLGRTSSLG